MGGKLGAKALIAFSLGATGGGLIGGGLLVFSLVLFPPGGEPAAQAVLPITIATATPKPSLTPDVRVEILAYGEKVAPLVEVRHEVAATELALWDSSNIDVWLVYDPDWQGEMKRAVLTILDADERIRQIEPPAPLRRYHSELLKAFEDEGNGYDYILRWLDNPSPDNSILLAACRRERFPSRQIAAYGALPAEHPHIWHSGRPESDYRDKLLEMAVEGKMKAIEHWGEAGRIIEQVLALYGMDLQ